MSGFGICFSSILLGTIGAWTVSQFAGKMGLLDCPNERSSHCTPTPRGGGIGIFATFLLVSIFTDTSMVFWLPISALATVAFWGDRIDLSPKLRLYTQLCLMAILVVGSGHLPTSPLWYLPWVFFWTVFVVGTANFYNFMDGINGIAGITGVVGFGLFSLYAFFNEGQSELCTITTCISLSCLGFLPLNMPKAKVFMGDVGSILLGSAFASLVFLASKTFLDFVCMASFLFPFYADELTTMVIRLKDGESLTQPHRRHLYQLLANENGTAHWKVSVSFGLLQLIVGVSALLAKPYGTLAILTLLILFFMAFASTSFYLRSVLKHSLQLQTQSRA